MSGGICSTNNHFDQQAQSTNKSVFGMWYPLNSTLNYKFIDLVNICWEQKLL